MLERDTTYFRIVCTIFWIWACFGFINDEILPESIARILSSVIYFACDVLLVIIGLCCLKTRQAKWIVFSFYVLSLASSLINHESLITFINGSRDFIGLLYAGPIVYYLAHCKHSSEYKTSLEKQLKIFLIIQAPCIVFQFIKYGAGDHGGGSMGYGNSGTISTLICIISFYFFSKTYDHDDMLGSIRRNWKYLFLLFPVFLNETKVSFVYLLIYGCLLYRFDFKSFRKILAAFPVIILLGLGAYFAYDAATNASGQNMDVADSDFIDEYLTGGSQDNLDDLVTIAEAIQDGTLDTENEWAIDLPRFAKLGFTPFALQTTRGGILLGAGIGQFKGGTTLETTNFAKENSWLLGGTRPLLLFILIQLGILGTIWFMWDIIYYMHYKTNIGTMSKQLKILLTAITLIELFYNDMHRSFILCYVMFLLAAFETYKWESNQTHLKS